MTRTTAACDSNGSSSLMSGNIHSSGSGISGQRITGLTASVSRITELRKRIQSSHLSYLSMEDKPEKIQFKSKLEGLIFELVSIVPHSQKFSNVEVANCFNQTVVEKEKFSPLHASAAFERIEKYATNLLRHPWRQEYRVIHSYSGFYRHLVHNCLIAVLPVMHAMGYRERDPDHPGQFILEQFIDPDRLASISLDCLIAFVELHTMLQMKQMLKTKDLTVSYDEIFTTRVRYICGMDQAVRIIADSCRSSRSKSPTPPPKQQPQSPLVANPLLPVSSTPLIKPAILSSSSNLPSSTSSFDLLSGISSPNSKSYPTERQSPLTPSVIAPPAMFANESSSSSAFPAQTNGHHQNLLLDHEPPVIRPNLDHLMDLRRNNMSKSVAGMREPIPRSESESSSLRGTQSPNYGGSYARKVFLEDQSNAAAAASPSYATSAYSGHRHPQRIDCVPGSSSVRSSGQKIVEHPISLLSEATDCGPGSSSRPLYHSLAPWSCSVCTFTNRRTSEFCEMCSRSREKGEPSPLVSGGKECSVCTLVNSREASHCRACGTDLFDSPTYI